MKNVFLEDADHICFIGRITYKYSIKVSQILKCKKCYQPFSSVRSAVNNKYRWTFFSSSLSGQCQRKTFCLAVSLLDDNYFKLLFSYT